MTNSHKYWLRNSRQSSIKMRLIDTFLCQANPLAGLIDDNIHYENTDLMDVRTLKMADACSISGYTRDQMRALLRDLPSFTVNQSAGRSRVFTRVELLAIAVISFMEKRYGMRRAAIGVILERLLETLQAPREVDPLACLVIVTGEASVSYTRLNEVVTEGLVIPLAPIFDRLDTYLGAKIPQNQMEISFGPSAPHKIPVHSSRG